MQQDAKPTARAKRAQTSPPPGADAPLHLWVAVLFFLLAPYAIWAGLALANGGY